MQVHIKSVLMSWQYQNDTRYMTEL